MKWQSEIDSKSNKHFLINIFLESFRKLSTYLQPYKDPIFIQYCCLNYGNIYLWGWLLTYDTEFGKWVFQKDHLVIIVLFFFYTGRAAAACRAWDIHSVDWVPILHLKCETSIMQNNLIECHSSSGQARKRSWGNSRLWGKQLGCTGKKNTFIIGPSCFNNY